MGRYQTEGNVQQEFNEHFPSGTGQLAFSLWKRTGMLHLKWKVYRSLYGDSPERVDLLNWSAPVFFAILDDVLLDDVLLEIARMTDSDRTGRWENASIQKLITILPPEDVAEHSWSVKLSELHALSDRIRTIRDKRLAHADLDSAVRYHDDPLPGVSRAYVEDVLKGIRDLLGSIENKYRATRTAHQDFLPPIGGVDALVRVLEEAHSRAS